MSESEWTQSDYMDEDDYELPVKAHHRQSHENDEVDLYRFKNVQDTPPDMRFGT